MCTVYVCVSVVAAYPPAKLIMAKEPFPLDRGWAWAVVVGSFVCVFFMVGTAKSLGLFLTEFENYFDIPTSLASMVMGSGAIVYAVAAPVCIMLAQTVTVRKMIMVGATIGFIGMSLGSLLISINYVIAVFGVCFGLGNASVYGNVLVMLGMYFRKHRALANGLALSGASIGQFALPPFIEYLLETYGLSGCILLVGGVYFHIVAAACLFRPVSFYASITEDAPVPAEIKAEEAVKDTTSGNGHGPSAYSKGDEAAEDNRNGFAGALSPLVRPSQDEFGSTREVTIEREVIYRSFMASTGSLYVSPVSQYGSSLLGEGQKAEEKEEKASCILCRKLLKIFDFTVMRSYIAVFLLVTCFLCFFGYFNFVLFLPAHVLTRGITKYNKAILVSLCGIGDLIGRLAMGILGDRNLIARYKMAAAGSLVVSVNIAGLVLADSFWWMAVHCTVYGIAGGIYVSLLAVVVVDFVGLKNMARLLAIIMLLQGVGASLGQPLLGAVKDETGSYDAVLIICAISALLGGLVLFSYPLVLRLEKLLPPERRLLPEPDVIEEELQA